MKKIFNKDKNITKDEIIDKIVTKKIWDVDKSFAYVVTKDFSFVETPKHGKQHYELVYCILKCKIDTMKSPTEKAAYLDCLSLNYKELKNTDIYDALISLFSGVCVGVSLLQDIIISALIMLMCLILFLMKIIVMATRRFSFYQMIIERLKDEIKS